MAQEPDQDTERTAIREWYRTAMQQAAAVSDEQRDEEVRVVRDWAAAHRRNAA